MDISGIYAANAIREKAERKRAMHSWMSASLIWLVALAILASATLAIYLFRQPIVERYPAIATGYKALGIEVAQGGIVFGDVITRSAYIEGELTVIVEGQLRNPDRHIYDLRPVVFSLVSPGGKALAQWTLTPGTDALLPLSLKGAETVSFMTQYTNPPVDATSLTYQFEADGSDQILSDQVLSAPIHDVDSAQNFIGRAADGKDMTASADAIAAQTNTLVLHSLPDSLHDAPAR